MPKEISDKHWRRMTGDSDNAPLTEEELAHLPSFSTPSQGGKSPEQGPRKNFISRFLDRDRRRKKAHAHSLTEADDHSKVLSKLESSLEQEYQARSPTAVSQAEKTHAGLKQVCLLEMPLPLQQ